MDSHHQSSGEEGRLSGRNLLVPRAQVLDVLKNLNVSCHLFESC